MQPSEPEIGSLAPPRSPVFATTNWNMVQGAGDVRPEQRAEALERLCRVYWYPVYAEIRRRGHSEHDAQDLAQDFFACLLRRESFAHADPTRGRFRSYLLGALNHFLADARDKSCTAKRGGGQTLVPLDEFMAEGSYASEPTSQDTPEEAFDRRWLMALLDRGLHNLAAEQSAADKAAQFARLKPFLAYESGPGDYQRVAVELGLKTGTIAVAVHRLRQRYREIIRDLVAQTVAEPAELESELRHLFGG